jgi:tetratricopeptide (TPR) repeat protein
MGINSGAFETLKVFSMAKIAQNEISFLDLLVAIETSDKRLSLLLAVCDRDDLRASITERYERELTAENISAYRVTIDHQDPSLYAAINKLIDTESYLQSVNPAVITVEGIVSLSDFAPDGARSPFDTFLGYLQWTREGMRKFPFPIVIWVSERIHNEISRKAQDFYSWRQGVFFFEAEQEPFIPIDYLPMDLTTDDSDSGLDLPIDELLGYISQREAEGKQDASLATFYTLLAKAYDKDKQVDLAIATWQKAIAVQQDLHLSLDLANSLNNLGALYCQQKKYAQAELLLKKSLGLGQELLGDLHPSIASSLNNLAYLYHLQGKYKEAEPLYKQSLSLRQELLGNRHPSVDSSLNNLALMYESQGRYKEAEALLRQSLTIRQELLGNRNLHAANGLNNLALLYVSQCRYKEAEPFLKQALELRRELLGERHPDVATSINNLAGLYKSQGRYEEAEPLFNQSLFLRRELLGNLHPDIADSLYNLAVLYHNIQRPSEALDLIQRAISIYKQTLGSNHPTTKAAQSWVSTISATSEKGKESKKKEKRDKGGFGVRAR